MKRAGFTMIELIFVIVILGILAAVALPKFAGVSDQANAQKCNAFVGTLNRTVGPSMWAESLQEGLNGVVDDGNITVDDHIALEDIPAVCLNQTPAAFSVLNDAQVRALLDSNISNIAFGESTYNFTFTEGSLSESPRWTWTKN